MGLTLEEKEKVEKIINHVKETCPRH